jgi:hypothetical protein
LAAADDPGPGAIGTSFAPGPGAEGWGGMTQNQVLGSLVFSSGAKEASTMNDPPDNPQRQLEFLRELLQENASIGGDVLEIARNTWAIHGVIPVDGEVLMAAFETYDEATLVLYQLRSETDSNTDLRRKSVAPLDVLGQ